MVTGLRPGGSWSITDTLRLPYTVIAKVRGIGVAVITSTCGATEFFFHNRALCATPKRCCSSITTNPRFLNVTLSSSRACVPTRIWSEPLSSWLCMVSRSAFFVEPVRSFMFIPIGAARLYSISKCCEASISVGAIMHAWVPLSSAISMHKSATSVLPLPTSPCNSRFICFPVHMSARISLITRCWAFVRLNGSCSK